MLGLFGEFYLKSEQCKAAKYSGVNASSQRLSTIQSVAATVDSLRYIDVNDDMKRQAVALI